MGVISGIVTYQDGRPSTMVYVSAAVGGITGGVTDRVRTDSQGRFTITWAGDGGADVVYLQGQEVARNVRNGTNNLHFHTR